MTEEQCYKNGGHRWEITDANKEDDQYVRIYFVCSCCDKTHDSDFIIEIFSSYFQQKFDDELEEEYGED